MLRYFETKLVITNNKLKLNQEHLFKACQELNTDDIQQLHLPLINHQLLIITTNIQQLQERKKEFSKDVAEYLSVDEVIMLLKVDDLLEVDVVSDFYTYRRSITIEERDKLIPFHYRFRDAKIK